ncbi:MAG: hypothetical protein KJ645_06950 [Planctomycetes bacterium]|nr:hypothetical protein [Planctomycetota bacterium]
MEQLTRKESNPLPASHPAPVERQQATGDGAGSGGLGNMAGQQAKKLFPI